MEDLLKCEISPLIKYRRNQKYLSVVSFIVLSYITPTLYKYTCVIETYLQ